MSNQKKKQLEAELTVAIESMLTNINKLAALKTVKTIKGSSKDVAKKFYKEIKRQEKKKPVKRKAKSKTKRKTKRARKAK
jgi:hypothetical protein